MADAVVSPLLKVLSKRLDSLADAFGHDLIFQKMREVLGLLGFAAREMEERSLKNEVFKLWLMELKDIAYRADDLLDDWELLAMERSQKTLAKTSPLKRTVLFFSFNRSPLVDRFKIVQQMKDLQVRFEQVLEGRTKYDQFAAPESVEKLQSSSLIFTESVYGRDGDKENIKYMLIGNHHQQVCVIPIVGMGGIGKTTLAQLVYNDEMVNQHFELKIWVHVGVDFDLLRIAEEILSVPKLSSMDAYGNAVSKQLRGKRFLIVLDDVWSENFGEWEILRRWFSVGDSGSSVIVTTRNEHIALSMTDGISYHLSALSDWDSWALFKCLAFRSMEQNVELEEIGMKIARKCGGLPLAVKVLGSLLRYKRQVPEWLSILDNDAWGLSEHGVLPVLKLSYDYLPAYLKQCFAYCSAFPKDYAINKEKLLRLWMAEGFIESTNGQELEDIADDYFVELLQRSFFQGTMNDDNGNIVKCQMHDLLHDLALHVAGIEYSIVEDGNSWHVSKNVRRISLIREPGPSTFPKMIHGAKKLRTLLLLSGKFETIPMFFQDFLYLRVLNLSGSGIRELPVTIGTLKHLRYLDLSHTYIRSIPKSISRLKYLQTLELSGCYNLLELPKAIPALTNLRHLDIRSCSLTHMPSGIGQLISLQNLSAFILSKKADCADLIELGGLNLRGRLDIKNLENVRNLAHAREAELSQKLRLHSLGLSWGRNAHLATAELSDEVLEGLMPSPNLKVLGLTGFNGSMFPSWIASCLPNLVKLSLINCSCPELPPLGLLPLLRDLFIKGMPSVHMIGYEFCGNSNDVAFPALRQLELYDMPNLLEWKGFKMEEEAVSFPCLDTLTVKGCSKLTALPSIPHLRNLALWHSNEMLLYSLVHLTSLSTLAINELQEPKSFTRDLGNLNSIEQLTMYDCDNLESLFLGMRGFSSLKHLSILYCQKLESLPMGLRFFASIKKLDIVGCEQLADISDTMRYLFLLEELIIEGCPMLLSVPDTLPTRLQKLVIRRCPQLEKRLDKKGEDWPKISHIPDIEIESGEFITEEGIL